MPGDEILSLSDAEYGFVVSLLYDRFGIQLGDQKRVLVAGRLTKRVRQLGLATFSDYFKYLKADPTGNELSEFINRLTTNHSFFYRERDHYDFLRREVFPGIQKELAANPGRPVRFWSAGCATGEEVYTLAIVIRDFFGDLADKADIALLATDISVAALTQACEGVYAGPKLSELPKAMRERNFRQVGDDLWAVQPELRRMVLFKRLNLMADRYPMKSPFDVVFCRNVMIYFDKASRSRLVRSFHQCVRPGGYLFIGHSETIPRDDCPFEYVKPAVYRRVA